MISLKCLLYSILHVFDSFGAVNIIVIVIVQDKDFKLWRHLIKMILLKASLQIPLNLYISSNVVFSVVMISIVPAVALVFDVIFSRAEQAINMS